MSTELLIQAEDFSLLCPHCDAEFSTIHVVRLYELGSIQCCDCLEDVAVCITVEPA